MPPALPAITAGSLPPLNPLSRAPAVPPCSLRLPSLAASVLPVRSTSTPTPLHTCPRSLFAPTLPPIFDMNLSFPPTVSLLLAAPVRMPCLNPPIESATTLRPPPDDGSPPTPFSPPPPAPPAAVAHAPSPNSSASSRSLHPVLSSSPPHLFPATPPRGKTRSPLVLCFFAATPHPLCDTAAATHHGAPPTSSIPSPDIPPAAPPLSSTPLPGCSDEVPQTPAQKTISGWA